VLVLDCYLSRNLAAYATIWKRKSLGRTEAT